MRWLKCDLQVQTPADANHWQGIGIEEGKEAESARAFAEACYDLGLDVVGLTDHNFLSINYIPYLQDAFNEIYKLHNHRIHLLLGFEFEAAGVGKGAHVLCLFEHNTSTRTIDKILAECGINHAFDTNGVLAKSDINLKEALKIVQDKYKGIIIMPHATSNDGIFDNDKISEWLQQDQFKNPKLLAIEVPKPVHLMRKSWQNLLLSTPQCLPEWKRQTPIATIMSSDNKDLIKKGSDGKHLANTLGYRYSWIKMSNPSIESLRQAFLDNQSRIMLPEDVNNDTHPKLKYKHPHIVSIEISDVAFLENQTIYFSNNLNCLIGGRGSGKSTIIEYLRILFQKQNQVQSDKTNSEKSTRIRKTLNEKSVIKVVWNRGENIQDTLIWENGEVSTSISGISDLKSFLEFLPIKIYSQQEVNLLSENFLDSESSISNNLLPVIDDFAKTKLEEVERQSESRAIEIKGLLNNKHHLIDLKHEKIKLTEQRKYLDERIQAENSIKPSLERYRLINIEKEYFRRIEAEFDYQVETDEDDNINVLKEELDALTREFVDRYKRFNANVTTPNHEWFVAADEKVVQAKIKFKENIERAYNEYADDLVEIFGKDEMWASIEDSHKKNDEIFKNSCTELGLSPDSINQMSSIHEEIKLLDKQLEELDKSINYNIKKLENFESEKKSLENLWHDEFEIRNQAIEDINSSVKLSDNQVFIKVELFEQKDKKNFTYQWNKFLEVDGRTKLFKNSADLAEVIFDSFCAQSEINSPWLFLYELINDESKSINLEFDEDVKKLFLEYIEENTDKWHELVTTRVADLVDIELYRTDGTSAGKISNGNLSDGQRNTIALALLLAEQDSVLIIDQPEDELDSRFIYNELVPMIRKMKSRRQLIFSTHNPNLPVNGDAELVYALQAENGKGQHLASGGLDNKNVTDAILSIMEGSEEAFRKRREKYNF